MESKFSSLLQGGLRLTIGGSFVLTVAIEWIRVSSQRHVPLIALACVFMAGQVFLSWLSWLRALLYIRNKGGDTKADFIERTSGYVSRANLSVGIATSLISLAIRDLLYGGLAIAQHSALCIALSLISIIIHARSMDVLRQVDALANTHGWEYLSTRRKT